jgi:RNA polymerase sigma-70 factor (ECF subfamily)
MSGVGEDDVRRLVDGGELNAATTAALRLYGAEVYRFITTLQPSEASTSDAFSLFAEGLWRGLGRFDWASSLRAWAYGIARRASLRVRRDEGRRRAHEVPWAEGAGLSDLVVAIRTETVSWLRTERKTRFRAIRDTLDPDDRALLVLRVDRDLSWQDCARVFHDADDEAPSLGSDTLLREAARLRKRYQLLKARLLDIGRREGLIRTRDPE